MKKTYRFLLALAVAAFSVSCIENPEFVGGTLTKDDIDAAQDVQLATMVNGIPAAMTQAEIVGTGSQSDFGLPAIHAMTENMLEDFVCTTNRTYDQFVYHAAGLSMGPTSSIGTYYWYAYYKWIKMANDVLAVANLETEDPEDLYYIGQAYAYRAMCYLDMARLYEPKQNKYITVPDNILGLTVPIVTEKTTPEAALNNPRAKRADMYKFILDDLKAAGDALTAAAKAGLQGSYTSPTIAAVYGMMARAYLEMGYWGDDKSAEYFANAATYSGALLGMYSPLTEAEWHDVNNGFNNGATNSSWIWGLPLASSNTNNLLNFTAMVSNEAQFGYGPLVFRGTTPEFYYQITDGDFRKESFIDPYWDVLGLVPPEYAASHDYKFSGTSEDMNFTLGELMYYGGYYASLKFRPAMGECSDYGVAALADHPLMRVEEMWFINMEATAHTTGVAAAKAMLEGYMNDYRMTGDAVYACPATVVDLDTFLTEMLLQKRAEFWGEGVLYYDYKRLNAPVYRILYDGSGEIDAQMSQYTTERSPQWNVCIPRSETQSNLGIPQEMNNPDPTGFKGLSELPQSPTE